EGDRETPARGDDDPARALALGPLQQDVGDHPITHEHEDEGAHQFCQESGHPFSPRLSKVARATLAAVPMPLLRHGSRRSATMLAQAHPPLKTKYQTVPNPNVF